MQYMEWSHTLDTGLTVIDHQHMRIVDYINTLYTANTAADKSEVKPILDELVDYTLTHFAFEETLMEEGGYPYLKAHKRVHDLFKKRVGEYLTRFASGEDVGQELLDMLKRWLVNHIKNEDADYVESARSVVERYEPTTRPSTPVPAAAPAGGWFAGAFRKLFA